MTLYKRNKIVYLPFTVKGGKINEYTCNMIKLLQDRYVVIGTLAELTDILQVLQTKAVFLNWVEDDLDNKMKAQLLVYKLLGAKIIWVFHNKYPHDHIENERIIKNIDWLANHSSIILLHSKNSRKFIPGADRNKRKAAFLPHILYQSQNDNVDFHVAGTKYGISENDFLFTIFGLVRPYKNIEGAIEAFQKLNLPDAKLLIAGNPLNSEYAKKIERLCRGNEKIILDMHYISGVMLDNIIDLSDVILLPYKGGSSMNSGVMIQAFSKGKTVIAPDICMARDMASQHFFYLYRKSLITVMKKAYENGKEKNREMGKCAKAYMEANNNPDIIKAKLFKILH